MSGFGFGISLSLLFDHQRIFLSSPVHPSPLTHPSAPQGRVFLTRDSKLAARRDLEAAVYLLPSNEPAEQLREVARHFGIRWVRNLACAHPRGPKAGGVSGPC